MIRRHWLVAGLRDAGWAPATVFVLHVFASQILHLYTSHPPTDIVMHLLGGAAIAYYFLRTAVHAARAGAIGAVNRAGLTVMTFGLTCGAAVFWEFAEYLSDHTLGSHAQRGLDDTLKDLLFGIVGGLIFLSGKLRGGGRP